MKRSYSVFADYHQFYLWDKEVAPDAPTDYTDADIESRIKAAPNVVVIQPASNMSVSVELEIVPYEPETEFEPWDHIAEASLELPSGLLEVHECTGGPIDQVILKPDTYRVRAYYGGLSEISDNGVDVNDHYNLVLWPAPFASVLVLKQFQGDRAGPSSLASTLGH